MIPDELIPRLADKAIEFTYNALIELWLRNLANNFHLIHGGKDVSDLPKRIGEPCICIGGGPSLAYNDHLRKIKASGWKHVVLCCDKELMSSLKIGLVPYAVASVDGSPLITSFYKSKTIRQHTHTLNVMLATMVHPSVVNALKRYKANLYWFDPMLDSPQMPDGRLSKRSIAYVMHVLTGKSSICSLGNVGAFLWNLAFELGCDPIILVGYDFSEQTKDKISAAYFLKLANMFIQDKKYGTKKKAMDASALVHQVEINSDFTADHDDLPYYKKGEKVQHLVNPIWKSYRNILVRAIRQGKRHTINCTGNGSLRTDVVQSSNFEAMHLEDAIRKYSL